MNEATTEYGACGIHVLVIAGEKRAVWAFQTSLRENIARELANRPSGDLEPGEHVRHERLPQKTSANDRKYWPFKSTFEKHVTKSPKAIFGLQAEEIVDGPDDEQDGRGIPF